MSGSPFKARVVRAVRKGRICYGCGRMIEVGRVAIVQPLFSEAGKMVSESLCMECGYLLHEMLNSGRSSLKEHGFSERKIPNVLRKKRDEFRQDPESAMCKAGLLSSGSGGADAAAPEIKPLVVSGEAYRRRIHLFPRKKYPLESFRNGETFVLRHGVGGESRVVEIQKAWKISAKSASEMFGKRGGHIVVLEA